MMNNTEALNKLKQDWCFDCVNLGICRLFNTVEKFYFAFIKKKPTEADQ